MSIMFANTASTHCIVPKFAQRFLSRVKIQKHVAFISFQYTTNKQSVPFNTTRVHQSAAKGLAAICHFYWCYCCLCLRNSDLHVAQHVSSVFG